MLRNEVKPGQWIVSGGAPVLAAACMMNLLFSPVIAAASLAVMLTGDAAAALIGRKFGKHKAVNGKSYEGFAAFIVAGSIAVSVIWSIIGMPGKVYFWGVLAVTASAIVELFQKQLKLDDNFTIPLTAGIVLFICFRLGM